MDYTFDDRPCVYFIQNSISKKCYIGSSIRVTDRIRCHFGELMRGVHHCEPLQRAVWKYGVEVFHWGVCEFVEDENDLLAREQHWIDLIGEYNTCKVAGSPRGVKMTLSDEERCARAARCKAMWESLSDEQRCYALSRAVDARRGVPISEEQKQKLSAATKGRPLTPEHREKISALNKSRQYTDEQRRAKSESIKAALAAKTESEKEVWKKNLSASMRGKPSPNKGKTMSQEARQKMSSAGKGKVISVEQKEKLRQAMLAKSPEWYAARAEKVREAKRRKALERKTPA